MRNVIHSRVILVALFYLVNTYMYGQVSIYAGTIGEERETRSRFHTGLDLALKNGTEVYCLETGSLYYRGSKSLAIGTYVYQHVKPHEDIAKLAIGINTIVQAGTLLGTIIELNHLHWQRSSSLIDYDDGKDFNVSSLNWWNPIHDVTPVDNVTPGIDYFNIDAYPYDGQDAIATYNLQVTPNGSPGPGGNPVRTTQAAISGKFEVLVNAEDARMGTVNIGGVAPYYLGYYLFDPQTNKEVLRHELSFANVPFNETALRVNGPRSNWSTPDLEWIVTRNAHTNPYQIEYENIRRKVGEPFSVSAYYPWQAMYPERENLKFRVYAGDYADNFHTVESGFTAIDNFKPFVASVRVDADEGWYSAEKQVYYRTWRPTGGDGKMRLDSRKINPSSFWDADGVDLTITVAVSEACEDLNVSIPSLSQGNVPIAMKSLSKIVAGALVGELWQIKLENVKLVDGCHIMIF
jgi:hypothetical protein